MQIENRLRPKDTSYRPEVMFSVLRAVPDFQMPVVGELADHVSRPCHRAPGFVIEHSECATDHDNYVKAVVFHREAGGEYKQHLFLVGFRSSSKTGPRVARRRLDEIVFPWIEARER
jgi:hypothetical protein